MIAKKKNSKFQTIHMSWLKTWIKSDDEKLLGIRR